MKDLPKTPPLPTLPSLPKELVKAASSINQDPKLRRVLRQAQEPSTPNPRAAAKGKSTLLN